MQYLRLDALEPYKLKECKFKFSHLVTAGTAWRELVSCCQTSRSSLPALGGATRCSSVTVKLYVELIMCMLEKARHKYVHHVTVKFEQILLKLDTLNSAVALRALQSCQVLSWI